MFDRHIINRIGTVLAGSALIAGLGVLMPDQDSAPVSCDIERAIVYTDPDGPGPLPDGLPRFEESIVVDFADGMTLEEIEAVAASYGLDCVYNSSHSSRSCLMTANVSENEMGKVLAELNNDSCVEAAEPNYVFEAFDKEPAPAKKLKGKYPNDPLYKHQWHLEQIGVRGAWRYATGKSAVVAVIDTGVAYKDCPGHVAAEDLAQTAIVKGYDFVNNNDEALDDHAHGTHVACTIAESTNNNLGAAGIAYNAAIMPIKVLSGRGYGSLSDIADGIRFAADHKANVINMSLGGPMPSQILQSAVKYANDKGTLVVCAAGNEAKASPSYPAAFPEAMAVSAVDEGKELAWYSNYGEGVEIAAPGGDTRADKNGDGIPDGVYQNTIAVKDPSKQGYYAFQGTSMASPHVAGAAALLASRGITNPEVMRKVLTNTSSAYESEKAMGAGILDACEASKTASVKYGFGRFACGAAVLMIAWGIYSSRKRFAEMAISLIAMTMAASGIIILPVILPCFGDSLLTLGIPAWDIRLLGAGSHGNPIFFSCFIPMLLSLAFSENRFWRAAIAGLAAGFAGHLIFEAMAATAAVTLLPSLFSRIWLTVHAVFCSLLSQVLAENTLSVGKDNQ